MKFHMKCTAFGKSTIGSGVTKKSAKHAAAELLLRKINKTYDSDEDDDDDAVSRINNNCDYVSQLLNFCVQRNFHKPEFTLTDSYGPTHCPVFTYECKLDSISRSASSSTKKNAKNLAAHSVLEILMTSYPDQEKKVMDINDQNVAKKEARRKITTYLELRNMEKTDKMGTFLSDRHNFLVNYKNEEFIEALKDIILSDMEVIPKYEAFLNEIETEWEYRISPFADTSSVMLEVLVDFDQFSINLVGSESSLPQIVIDYFTNMLHLAPIPPYVPGNVVSMDEIQLIPLSL